MFFDEIMKEHINGNRIHVIPDNKIDKLQRALGSNCLNYMINQYALMIYGDNGKPTIIDKVLQRVIVDTLGKYRDNIHITIILDDDGVSYTDLKNNVLNKLQSISKDKSKFNPLSDFEEDNGSFIMKHPRSRGTLIIKLSTIPLSLEYQVAEKMVGVTCPHNSGILNNGARDALKYLVKEYYDGNEEKLIRDSATQFVGEIWVKEILRSISFR